MRAFQKYGESVSAKLNCPRTRELPAWLDVINCTTWGFSGLRGGRHRYLYMPHYPGRPDRSMLSRVSERAAADRLPNIVFLHPVHADILYRVNCLIYSALAVLSARAQAQNKQPNTCTTPYFGMCHIRTASSEHHRVQQIDIVRS